MTTKITDKDKEFLLSVAIPERTYTYTPISHEFAISEITKKIEENNLKVTEEKYRSTANGNVANGVFKINHTNDEQMKMICCFSNSYDKSTRFSVAVGAEVEENGNYFLSDISWIRKHSGRADKEALNVIEEQIKKSGEYFDKLVAIKHEMEKVRCTRERYGSMIGQLYVNELLNTEQVSVCFHSWKDMEVKEDINECSLWRAYNFVLTALKQTHPSRWISNQIYTNMYVLNMFKIKVYMNNEQTEMDFSEDDDIANPDVSTDNSIEIIQDEPIEEISNDETENEEEEEEKEKEEKKEEEEIVEKVKEEQHEEIVEETTEETVEEPEEEIEVENINGDIVEEILNGYEETEEQEHTEVQSGEKIIIEDMDTIDRIADILDSMEKNEPFVAYKVGDDILIELMSETITLNESDLWE